MMKRRMLAGFQAMCVLAFGVTVVLAGAGMVHAGVAIAEPSSHIFDPALSLTGGCTTSEDDPIPDPGCPYPPPPAGPSESFIKPTGIAIDSFGDVYVAVMGPEEAGEQKKAHIDVFDSEGLFLTEIPVPREVRTVAVDSKGYLYAYFPGKLLRYDFVVYDPLAGEVSYDPVPSAPLAESEGGAEYAALAVNPEDDHLFVNFGSSAKGVYEYGPGEDGNPLLDDEVAEVHHNVGASSAYGLAIDATRDRLYVTDQEPETLPGPSTGERIIRVFELQAPHDEIEEPLDGSSLPEGTFVKCGGNIESCSRGISIAVDESTGHLFVYDKEKKRLIYELTEDGQYLATIEKSHLSPTGASGIAVDNGENSPHGALNGEGRYLWATDMPPGVGHAYAFKPTHVTKPGIELSFSDVSETEAALEAVIDPGQAQTTYSFEFTSLEQFEAVGFQGAQVARQGTISAGALPVTVSAEATGLMPGTAYVFRVIATNELGEVKAQEEFRTYPSIAFGSCPNDAFRTGASGALPDCRAYELVTPPDTGGRPPLGMGGQGLPFPSPPASPAGDRVFFRIENGLIPGLDATASLHGDPYLSARGPGGWNSVATGGKGTDATGVASGSRSPDQTYSVWAAEGLGPAVIGGTRTVYVRYPDGHSELFGRGSLGVDPHATPELISEGGGHMVFTSSMQLEPGAAAGTAVYDRTADGVTHVVSLLPGDITPPGSSVSYRGSSLDGLGIAFEVTAGGATTLYLRYNDQQTYKVAEGVTFEGVAEGGRRIFYLQGTSLLAFDVTTGTINFGSGNGLTVVNVSPDGSTAYFVSTSKLTPVANPQNKKPTIGEQNLYQSREGTVRFVGTVSQEDVTGESINVFRNGLGLWARAVHGEGNNNPGGYASDPSRTTDDGTVMLFQSNSDLTGYASGGARQIYRYDSSAGELDCLSCNPTGAPPAGDALLQNVAQDASFPEPNGTYDVVQNLSTSGLRAFFQSPDPLVAADTDGLQDVYEWEAAGVGSCRRPGGCVYLISSGRSEKVNYLYAASKSGDDVFFRSSDRLVPADREAVPSIYDARVGGGFPEPEPAAECEGEGCRPQITPAPFLPTPGSTPGKSGNVKPKCPKGKRSVRRHGKVRCIKKKKPRHHHRRASGTGRKGAAK
jgi:hypothetical protein